MQTKKIKTKEVKDSKLNKKTNKEVKDSKVKKASKDVKTKVIKNTKEAKVKKEVTKEVAKQQKVNLVENVISHRSVKYLYPEDVVDTLSRKTWRQKVRNELHRLELKLNRIKDQNSKEWKKANKEYEDYKSQILKPEQIA